MSEKIPIVEIYRGVGLHDQQSAARLKVVRAEIDAVYLIDDIGDLFEWVARIDRSPESRLFASAKVESLWDVVVETRARRPDISLSQLHAHTAGLDSQKWRDARYYGSLLDPCPPLGGGVQPVRREHPLTDDD